MSRSEHLPNPKLTGKVVYLVATGAHKVFQTEDILDGLLALEATVIVFMTYPAEQMISKEAYARIAAKCDVRRDFSWYQPSAPLPDEDLVLIAPCTFNSLVKLSLGIADDYALTIASNAIARHKPLFIAPAFNESWYHPATAESIARLEHWGARIIYPEITPEKVTMMDVSKILDYTTGSVQKIKFDSIRHRDTVTSKRLESARATYLKDFQKLGIQQHATGNNSGTHGCYSVRVDNGWALVTASGANLSTLASEDLTLLSLKPGSETVEWCGDKAPTSESPLHIDLYLQSDTKAIIHSHNPKLTYASALAAYTTPKYIPYGNHAHTQSVTKQALAQDGFVILKYHGEVYLGTSLEVAGAAVAKIEGAL